MFKKEKKMSMTLVEDLGMRREGKTTRRWCMAECSYCNQIVERRTDQIKLHKSCGCATYLKAHTKHGKSRTRIYSQFGDMLQRCNNSNNARYDRYGGRGIKICKEWNNDFMAYYNWAMKNGYTDELTIDRINNDKGYSPDNCEFVTLQENLKRRDRSRNENRITSA